MNQQIWSRPVLKGWRATIGDRARIQGNASVSVTQTPGTQMTLSPMATAIRVSIARMAEEGRRTLVVIAIVSLIRLRYKQSLPGLAMSKKCPPSETGRPADP